MDNDYIKNNFSLNKCLSVCSQWTRKLTKRQAKQPRDDRAALYS